MKKIFLIIFLLIPILANAKSYRSELRSATERGQIYDTTTWDAKLIWHATLFTDEYRRAYTDRHIKINHLSARESARYVATQMEDQAEEWEFFISFYSKKAYKHFEQTKNSFWKIELSTSSGEVLKPYKVEFVPITPYQTEMFPHLNMWSKAYKVTFRKAELGKKASLSLKSVVGSSVLKFKLK